MSYNVLARKYRPQKFIEIIGQEHVITALQNSLKADSIGHAYLFYGPRGVGKTSTARLLAKTINCTNAQNFEPCNECISCKEITNGNSLDVIEIDAASNRGIDNIRELRENVKFLPIANKYKVYIIDEVHMLTLESFNALLKTLEEPPAHIKFIFATTAYRKIPPTILSRCQEFHFHRVRPEHLQKNLTMILDKEKIQYQEDALFWIVDRADGSVRDSLSILDQSIAYCDGNIQTDKIQVLLGINDRRYQLNLLHAILERDFISIANNLKELLLSGINIKDFLWNFLLFIRSHMHLKQGIKDPHLIGIPESSFMEFQKNLSLLPIERWNYLMQSLYQLFNKFNRLLGQNGLEDKIYIELGLQKISEDISKPSVINLLEQIQTITQKLNTLEDSDQKKEILGETLVVSSKGNVSEDSVMKRQNNVQSDKQEMLQKESTAVKEEGSSSSDDKEITDKQAEKDNQKIVKSLKESPGKKPDDNDDDTINAQDLKSTFMGTEVTGEDGDKLSV
jgi:DNA polymerase-3 subunit gamma/tau